MSEAPNTQLNEPKTDFRYAKYHQIEKPEQCENMDENIQCPVKSHFSRSLSPFKKAK